MALLTTKQLSVSIADQSICQNLNLSLQRNDIWALLGANGAGKTTLLHTLAGLRNSDSGDLLLNNTPLKQLPRRHIAQQLGILLQDHTDSFPSTVMEATLIGRHPHLRHWQWESNIDKKLALQALQAVDMHNKQEQSLQTLSGGERRRVDIATLLTQNPQVFLLDEPTNHLDLHYQITLLDKLIKHIHEYQGCALMSLHDVNIASRFCNKALLIFDNGETICGHLKDVLNVDNLTRLYHHPVEQLEKNSQIYFVAAY